MPNIMALNLGNSGSTGKIALQIGQESKNKGFAYYFSYPERPENRPEDAGDLVIMSFFSFRVSRKLDYLFGNPGICSYFSTKRLLKRIKKLKIDTIHIHNIHGGFINLKLLFNYIKKNDIRVIWTLHDCWAFTGRCPHFQISGCNQWKDGCQHCLYPSKMYPPSLIDRSSKVWSMKKKLFLGIKRVTIVTPSVWLSKMVGESFLQSYPVTVINNGIDLDVFVPQQSNFRKKLYPKARFAVLGVSFGWSNKKGLDIFIQLAKVLPSDYQIVLVGTDAETDQLLPHNIISIHRTNNQKELAEIYSSVDLFLNFSREENFPTVNIESLACGTPVLTFDTGGSAEIIDETCGSIIDSSNIILIKDEILRICETKPYSSDACIKRSRRFSMDNMTKKYIDLYGN